MAGTAADTDGLRRWRGESIAGLAAAIEANPDATVPAYPAWTVRDLAIHVATVYGNTTLALRTGSLDKPSPEVDATRDDPPARLAELVQEARRTTDGLLASCDHEQVWAPVGPRSPSFWARRLLREAVLHRWDAEAAGGTPAPPQRAHALELLDEFLDTDVTRALGQGGAHGSGPVTIRADGRAWVVDLAAGTIDTDGTPAPTGATISGDPASVWLWCMRRDRRPEPILLDDVDGNVTAFAEMIDAFNRPSR